ncbi:MAG: glycosyltransferase [Rubrobacteraceae bacterium]|nr:glycosyltransferase [Rubrobacteraceae bacterium]
MRPSRTAPRRAAERLGSPLFRRRRLGTEERRPDAAPRVLVLTARVGGGHEAVGRTVGAELEAAGYAVESRDGLRAMGFALNWALTRGYRSQARHLPASLGAIFAVTSHPAGAGAVRGLVGVLYARRLMRLVREAAPDAVISTYPLVTAALGRLRRDGSLPAPALAIIPDYGVHPLWVIPDLDLHLVASPRSAELAAAAGGTATPVRMPVAPGFRDTPDREVARATLGIPEEAFVALLVGGVWGIGDLEGAAACALHSGAYTVVVTGENEKLKRRLEKRFAGVRGARILGWRDDMPRLMAAADCLVQNAGGMTCLEAIESGLPILLFDPILGHGELNARVMEEEGLARVANTPEELGRLLRESASEARDGGNPGEGPQRTEIRTILAGLLNGEPERRPASRGWRLRPALAGIAAACLVSWSLFASSGAAVGARALSLDVVGAGASGDRAALAVRVTEPETAAAVQDLAEARRLPLAVFTTARAAGGLAPSEDLSFGIAEEPSGFLPASLRDRREARDAAARIARATGREPRFFLPARHANLAALAEAPPRAGLVMASPAGTEKDPAGVVLADVSGLTPKEARSEIDAALEDLEEAGLECAPLEEL